MSYVTNMVSDLEDIQGARLTWSQEGQGYSTGIFIAGLNEPASVAAQIADVLDGKSAMVARNLYGLYSWNNRNVANPVDVGQEPRRVRLIFQITFNGVPVPYTKGIWVPAMLATSRTEIQQTGMSIADIYAADANVTSCRFLVPYSNT